MATSAENADVTIKNKEKQGKARDDVSTRNRWASLREKIKRFNQIK